MQTTAVIGAILNDVKALEERLSVPAGTFEGLREEDDWSFTIKLHALIEAAVSHLLTKHFGKAPLQDVFSSLPLANRRTGKLAFTQAADLLDEDIVKFIVVLSEIRNGLVHKVSNLVFDYSQYLTSLSVEKREDFIRMTLPFVTHRKVAEANPKLAIFVCGMGSLARIHSELEKIRLHGEADEARKTVGDAFMKLGSLLYEKNAVGNAGSSKISIERWTAGELLNDRIFTWPIWEKEVSEFPWHYDEQEVCYLLEGDVTVTPDGGQPVHFGKGDLVTFPAGMSCVWTVHKLVRKHYKFG